MTQSLGVIELYASGLGLMLYSPGAVADLREGEDYYAPGGDLREPLCSHVAREQRVVMLGSGSPQVDYRIHVARGRPPNTLEDAATSRARFGLRIDGGALLVRDGYDPMRWEADTPYVQRLSMVDGLYAVHALHVGAFGVEPPYTPDDPDGPMVIHLFFEPTDTPVSSDGWPLLDYRVC